MALESAFKKDIEKASRAVDALNRLYNIYFSGGEDDPPHNDRKALDALVVQLKSQLAKPANSADRFQAQALVSRYQIMVAKWDKTLRAIETGQIPRPKKRK